MVVAAANHSDDGIPDDAIIVYDQIIIIHVFDDARLFCLGRRYLYVGWRDRATSSM